MLTGRLGLTVTTAAVVMVVLTPTAALADDGFGGGFSGPNSAGATAGITVHIPGSPGRAGSPGGPGLPPEPAAPAAPAVAASVDPCAGADRGQCLASLPPANLTMLACGGPAFPCQPAAPAGPGVAVAPAVPAVAAVPAIPPRDVALMAVKQITVPSPVIRTSPTRELIVGFPTWMWLDSSSLGSRSTTASVPGVSVTATVTPVEASWDMGDGSAVTCAGSGTPYTPGVDPLASSPTCGHTYTHPGELTITVRTRWSVSWSGAGTGGTLPDITVAASRPIRVIELQAVNT